jgi:hypothetical protein
MRAQEETILGSSCKPMSIGLNEFLNRPVVGFFDFGWKHAAWKLVSFQMIPYTFTAFSLLVTRHISASAVFRVNLYIGTRLSITHFGNLNFFQLREGYIVL